MDGDARLHPYNERPTQIVCPNSDSVCPNSDKIYLTRVTFKFLFRFHARRDSSLPSGSWIFPRHVELKTTTSGTETISMYTT
jgi:hypothetical protein